MPPVASSLPAAHGGASLEDALRAMVREDDALMALLRDVRALALPDAWIGAGAVRDRVWDRLHGMPPRAPRDVDVVFFDPGASEHAERQAERALADRRPDVLWEVTNQATVHLWYRDDAGREVPALRSCEEGIATWPETPTCVGVRLREDDTLEVCAPHGLEDLFALRWRRNPRRASLAVFEERLAKKRVEERWPRARIER